MQINIFEFIEGAKKARGLTVVIDVFRAFSLECYLFQNGASRIFPIGDLEKAYRLKRENPSYILIGERKGVQCEGTDYGNSPSQIKDISFSGKTIIHTTSAGTQGVVNASCADEIITGSLVNARAVASYIKKKDPEIVSLLAMGANGVKTANEDILCAEYIRSLLLNQPFPMEERLGKLRTNGGEHFFDPNRQQVFPENDYWMCTKVDRFPFILKVHKQDDQYIVLKEEI